MLIDDIYSRYLKNDKGYSGYAAVCDMEPLCPDNIGSVNVCSSCNVRCSYIPLDSKGVNKIYTSIKDRIIGKIGIEPEILFQ